MTQSSTLRAPLRALTCAAVLFGASNLAFGQGKTDTVYRLNPRSGKTIPILGTVTEDGLERLTIKDGEDKETKVDSSEVLQVVWGSTPIAFGDGKTYQKRSKWEDAIKSYRDAAADGSARGPVKAAARLLSLQAMMAWGESEPARFADAVGEADRFISEFSDSRHFPLVRSLKARAAWLSGDTAAARDGYNALFEAGKDGATGYSPVLMANAALSAGHAAVAAGDPSGARTLYTSAEAAFRAVSSSDDPTIDAAAKASAKGGAEVAALGESFSKVARGDFSGAKSALERAVDKNETTAGKAAARLALGQAHLGLDEHYDAMVHFGWVSAMDHTNADRRAAALLGLADASLKSSPETGAAAAKSALERIMSEYGGTTSAAAAAERLKMM